MTNLQSQTKPLNSPFTIIIITILTCLNIGIPIITSMLLMQKVNNGTMKKHPYNECLGIVLYKTKANSKEDVKFANEICYPLTKIHHKQTGE